MVKKKNSIALFEVISKSKESRSAADMGVPAWMGGEQQDAVPQAAPRMAPSAPKPPPPPVAPRSRTAPLLAIAGQRLQFSLNYISCLILAAALLVLLGGAFWLGRKTAPAPPDPDRMPAEFRAGLLDGQTGPGQQHSELPRRIPGKYYIVIESMEGATEQHLKEANRIAEFCITKGEPAEVRTYRSRYVVWSLTPFDSPNDEKARSHALTIEKYGGEYFAKHRTYRFQQRKRPGSQLDPLYLPHRQAEP